MSDPTVERTLLVADPAPARLETVVRGALPALSRRTLRRLIADGAVRLNGRRARKGTVVCVGDRITLPDLGALLPEPELLVATVYADRSLVAVDKPGGMRGHALDPRQRGTVAAFLLGRFPDVAEVGPVLAPGLVHRLDTGTSGLLLAARTPAALAATRTAFRNRTVEKRYLAIVSGRVRWSAPERITTALAHDPRDPGRMVPATPGRRAWAADSTAALVAAGAERSLVAITIRTGVTHQARVHLALLGHPVLGDARYGTETPLLPAGRHALHAERVALPHPVDGARLELFAPLPPDLNAILP